MALSVLFIGNALLPGSGLLVRGRMEGALVLVPALLGASALCLAFSLGIHAQASRLGFAGLAVYLFSVFVAIALWWRAERRERLDPTQIRARFSVAAAHYLRSELPEAERAVKDLITLAPEEPGVWRFFALVIKAMGDPARAAAASRRADKLDARTR